MRQAINSRKKSGWSVTLQTCSRGAVTAPERIRPGLTRAAPDRLPARPRAAPLRRGGRWRPTLLTATAASPIANAPTTKKWPQVILLLDTVSFSLDAKREAGRAVRLACAFFRSLFSPTRPEYRAGGFTKPPMRP